MSQKTELLLPIMESQPVIPVLLIDEVRDAVPLARALAKGGLKAVEVTLRTPAAIDAIRAIANEVPEAVVGAGTVLNSTQYRATEEAGARFIVCPGLTVEIVDAAKDSNIPLLPGVITPSEIMGARQEGYQYLKFFPAEQAGGIDFVKALASPFADIKFCPTGGINAETAPDWLKLPNVICVGGSWPTPKKLVDAGNWDAITALAETAAKLK